MAQSSCFGTIILLVLVLSSVGSVERATAQIPRGFPDDVWKTDWSKHNVPLSEIEMNLSKDAIPAINSPVFIAQTDAASWISTDEPVLSVVVDGSARAYPLQILIWHEMVNDVLNGKPIVVTFCPLCYSALVFGREINGRTVQFGVSGALRHSDLVMYDAETHSLWQQISGEAIVGARTGMILDAVPAQIISFGQFRASFPDGDVLSKETGFTRRYGQNPYPGYDNVDERPWLYKGSEDSRVKPMEKVVTVSIGGQHKAYPHTTTRASGVINDQVGNALIVLFHTQRGARSALDQERIQDSKRVGSTGVFSRTLNDGRVLTFVSSGGQFKDTETGSVWGVSGLAVSGPLAGTRLTPIVHGDIFSFAWFVIHPESSVYEDGN